MSAAVWYLAGPAFDGQLLHTLSVGSTAAAGSSISCLLKRAPDTVSSSIKPWI